MALSVADPRVSAWEISGLGSLGSPRAAAPLPKDREEVCVPGAVTSQLPSPCLLEALPSPPLEPARGMAGGMLRHPQLPGESSLWLCNLHQRCFLKHYCPMRTLPAGAAPCPEGLELVSAIFPSRGTCQPHALSCFPGSVPHLPPRAPWPHVPGTAQVLQSHSGHLPAHLALPPCVLGLWGCRESKDPIPLLWATGVLGHRAWGHGLILGMPPRSCQLGHTWHGPGSGQSGLK